MGVKKKKKSSNVDARNDPTVYSHPCAALVSMIHWHRVVRRYPVLLSVHRERRVVDRLANWHIVSNLGAPHLSERSLATKENNQCTLSYFQVVENIKIIECDSFCFQYFYHSLAKLATGLFRSSFHKQHDGLPMHEFPRVVANHHHTSHAHHRQRKHNYLLESFFQ